MQPGNKMLSEAGKSYDKTRIVKPYNTRQRWRYYQQQPVQSTSKIQKHYQTLDGNLRQKRDSYLLRYAKDITLNTNHSPNVDIIRDLSPRPIFPKGAFERYIGDIRDQDFKVPLHDKSNHRCLRANNQTIQTQRLSQMDEDNQNVQHRSINVSQRQQKFSLDLSTNLNSVDLSKVKMSRNESAAFSLIKKRSKLTIEVEKSEMKKQEKIRGVSFDSSVGHRYLKEIDNQEPGPEFYDIQKSKQSLIKNSFREPRIHVKFGMFKDSIATRLDRADPNWHLINDTSNCSIEPKDLSYNFNHYSDRKINEVKSKYPHRHSMNLYMFPVKDLKV